MKIYKELPRLPLDGRLDLTYRCNNVCRHCWLWLSPDATLAKEELAFDEIRRIVDDARQMGCQAWGISGGEPMIRSDFADILDYITRRSLHYKLNTNGTLITSQIAQLLTRKGRKMVALYGATEEVHDHVTRNPGSFESTMRGFAYMREAGAAFEVQIVPMRDNYHQYQKMVELAQTLSPQYRVGAPWLWLSACGSEIRNHEITKQRLDPADVITLDEPNLTLQSHWTNSSDTTNSKIDVCSAEYKDDRLFSSCIAARRDFHIDPYGQMSFCYYIKDPALRYDLRNGSIQQAWDEFIPSLANAVHGGQEYLENCGSCALRRDCRWCAVYGYLEHGRYSARVEYLCQVAKQMRHYTEEWKSSHMRYYQIAGTTIQISADFPIEENTYAPKYRYFEVDKPGKDTFSLQLLSSLPSLSAKNLGRQVYNRPPWAIYRKTNGWIYLGITSEDRIHDPFMVAIFDEDHHHGSIYHHKDYYQKGALQSLTTFTSDQIWLARAFANRQACFIHSSGIIINGKGLLFVGHSEAGKSTMMKMLNGQGEMLCDDRNIIRRWPDGFRIHGTWSHGELPDVSPSSAPLKAIIYLEKAPTNELIPLDDKRERLGRFLSHLIKPVVTEDWWDKMLDLAGKVSTEVPTYRLRFDKSGKVVDLIQQLCADEQDV